MPDSGAAHRLTANDLTTLAVDRGQVPMNIGAVLFIDAGPGAYLALSERLASVPRLRQRLLRPRRGAPGWVQDPDFDLSRHARPLRLPAAGEAQVLDAAARLICTRLDPAHPLWTLRWIDSAGQDGSAAVLVLHHVLADGMGGLALLAAAADSMQQPAPTHPTAPAPPNAGASGMLAGLRELGLGSQRPRPAVGTSITRPTSRRREVRYLAVRLADIRDAAHRHAATVNDVILTAAAGALIELLARRGEQPGQLVFSVPISARTQGGGLGNEVGAVPVAVPAAATAQQRLRIVTQTTRHARAGGRGSSAAVLNLLFQPLARIGAVGWFLDHQRMVHTFETNLAGPAQPLSLGGANVRRIVPMAVNPGNVGVSFDVLSYAGELVIAVIADPRQARAALLADLVRSHLAGLVEMTAVDHPPAG